MPKSMSEDEKEEMDEKTLTSIQLCLLNEVLPEVVYVKTATSLWLKLESLYMTKTIVNRLHLKQQLFMLRIVEGTSIKSHFDDFSSVIMDLENIDVKIEDEDQVLLLLCSLPPSYNHFRETLIYDKEEISIDDFKLSLFSKDLMDRELTNSNANDGKIEAFNVRGRNMEQNLANKSKEKSKFCNYYKKKWHIIDDC